MACIKSDGKPSASGFRMLRALKDGLDTPEKIASGTGVPLFQVRSGLREMETAGMVSAHEDKYQLEPKGKELADSVPS